MSQRDDYVNWLLARNGWAYCNEGPWRCDGSRHCFDCSGFLSGSVMAAVGATNPPRCGNTDTLASALIARNLTCDRATARATRGAWAIRTNNNPTFPGDGHMVCSLGDGRTIEAHSHADGIYIGSFDGNRGFQVYGYPPGIAGFDQPPGTNPGPTTPQEARDMGMTAAKVVPGSHVQNKPPWFERYPFVGALHQPNGTTDIVGFNGAKITNPKTVTQFGMTVLHLGTLRSPIEDIDAVDANTVVALAGDGGSFVIHVTAEYI